MAKPKSEKRDPRLVVVGNVVRAKDGDYTEVVRGVSVTLHLANGMNESYQVGEHEVDVVLNAPATIPPELPEQADPEA